MIALVINNETYNVEFDYNDFCDTDLLERVDTLMKVIGGTAGDGIQTTKDVFCVVRELLFTGIKSDNRPNDIKGVGKLLDVYRKEKKEEDNVLMELFVTLTDELFDEGFLHDLVQMMTESEEQEEQESKVVPMEKKTTKKVTK